MQQHSIIFSFGPLALMYDHDNFKIKQTLCKIRRFAALAKLRQPLQLVTSHNNLWHNKHVLCWFLTSTVPGSSLGGLARTAAGLYQTLFGTSPLFGTKTSSPVPADSTVVTTKSAALVAPWQGSVYHSTGSFGGLCYSRPQCLLQFKQSRQKHTCAFDKKLQALFVPSPSFCALDKTAHSDRLLQARQEHSQWLLFGKSNLQPSTMVLLLIKASQAEPVKLQQPDQASACLNFNLRQRLVCNKSTSHLPMMLRYTGKTHFENNFINSFYSHKSALLCELSKPTGAGIDVFRYQSVLLNPSHCGSNGLKVELSKAQLSSLASQVCLNHLMVAKKQHKVFGQGLAPLRKTSPLIKTTILETMQLVLGAFIMLHGKIWFISANELTQCCFIYCNSKQPYLQISAADVGVVQCLNKGSSQCVTICSHGFKQLPAIISQWLRSQGPGPGA